MGRKSDFNKPPSNDQSKASHFSHPHPLTLIDTKSHQQPHTGLTSCAGCKLKPSGSIYSCTACGFFLHRKCLQMPKTIRHPGHESHALTLLPEPAYATGGFVCDACHGSGDGFSYHCATCGVDLHVLCAVMPQSVSHAGHGHELKMAYQCPYFTQSFIMLIHLYVCRSPGSNHWLYSCTACGFDAHLKCATGGGAPPPPGNNNPNNAVDSLSAMFSGLGANGGSSPLTSLMNNHQGFGGQIKPDAFTSYNQIIQQIMDQYNKRGGVPQGTTQRSDESTAMAYLQQIIDQQNKQGGGVDAQQFVSYLNGFSKGGGGGGGGADFVQGLMGGGGLDALNSLLGGGAGI